MFVLCSPPFRLFSVVGVAVAKGVLLPDTVLSLPAPGVCPAEPGPELGTVLIPFNMPNKFAWWFSSFGGAVVDPAGTVEVGGDVRPAKRSERDTAWSEGGGGAGDGSRGDALVVAGGERSDEGPVGCWMVG